MGLLLLSAAVTATAQNIWKTEAISVKSGDTPTIQLALENIDSITALQFDLAIPQGMALDPSTASLSEARKEEHTLTVEKQDTSNVYRFLLHNTNNKAIKGNDGTLISFPVTIGDGFKSSTLAMSNVVMTNKKAENLSYSTQFGLISLITKQKVVLSVSGLEQRVNGDANAEVTFSTVPENVKDNFSVNYYSDANCSSSAENRKTAGIYYVTFAYGGCDTLEALNDTMTMIVSNKQNIDFKAEGTILPIASTIMQGQPLSASILSGGKASVITSAGASPLPGTFAWTNGNEPATATGAYSITFSPDDYANYVTKDTVINLTVIPVYQVFVSQPENGSISATGMSGDNRYAKGQTLSLKAIPASNYQFVKWSNDVKTDATTWEVNGNGTISAVFAPITRKVMIEAGEGGSLSITADGKPVASGSSLIQGSELNITATPNSGYSLGGLTLNNAAFSSAKYILGKEDVTFEATFAERADECPVTATATNGIVRLYRNDGTPIPSGTALPDGTAFKAIPFANAGYELSALWIDGENVTGEEGVYSGMVDGETTVSATFNPKKYTLSIAPITGGTLSVKNGAGSELNNGGDVEYNSSVVIEQPTASEGYKFLSLIANGQRIEQFPATLTVSGDLAITATFEELTTIMDKYIINTKQTYTYNGQYKAFIIRTSQTHAADFNVAYKEEGGSVVSGVPINAGTYNLTITRPADDVYKAYTSGADYFKEKLEIAKAKIAVTEAPKIEDGKITNYGNTTLGSDTTLKVEQNGNVWKFSYTPKDGKKDNYDGTVYYLSTGTSRTITISGAAQLRSTGTDPEPAGYVRISNGGKVYTPDELKSEIKEGIEITVEAVPDENSRFVEWKEGAPEGKKNQPSFTTTVNSNMTFTPRFTLKENVEVSLSKTSSEYGEAHDITLSSTIENAQISIFKDEECTQPAELKNAGSYYVRIYRPATDKENEINKVLPYSINPATPTPVAPTTTDIAAGETLAQVQMLGGSAGSVAGTFSWKDSATVVKAGTNTYPAVFTSADPNYASVENVPVSITGLSATKSNDPGPGPDPTPDPDPENPDVPTSIEEIASETQIVVNDGSLLIYPCVPVDVAVISIDGKYIFRDKVGKMVNVRIPQPGVYIVSFMNEGKRVSRKVCVL
ncbi:InlB B-repeat-containing protein [uncultured Parabacteroides sp.]|uniref:InlB B-repeat-containing protein n=1 Tax=uncultured Parabacteroides sp. TaxID=512312 RepID=UPI0026356BD8|nr:hypothetical protein [uncultured Parabacteroides sp.]